MELLSAGSSCAWTSGNTFVGVPLPSAGVVVSTPVQFRSSQKGGGCITICKYKGQKRVPSGKTVREKGKDPAARREELLRKSKGPSDAGSNKQSEAENADPWGAFLRANGAFSVPALQPIDEGYSPLVGLSVKDRYRSRSSDSPSLDRSSPPNNLTDVSNEIVSREMVSVAQSEEKRNRGATSTEERSASQETDHTIDLGSGFADDDSETWEGEDDEEWVEVGLDDDEADEDGQVEEADYWEGDLPSLTPEEEEELLREAERELAELESLGDAGKDADLDLETSESSADLAISQRERKLAKLKNIVQQMEETLAKEKRHTQTSKASNAFEGDPLGGNNGEAIGSEPAADGEDNGYEEERDEEGEEDGEDTQNVVQKKSKMLSVNGQQPDRVRIESKRLNLTERRQSLYYWDADDEVEDVDEQAKERKGVPAVMRCFDKAKVFVKAGDGGNGEVAFRREKFVPFGGPSGGNGGRGGNVYVEVDSEMNSLLPFRKTVHFRAGRGSHGGGKGREGATGTDCTMAVPPGTVIREDGPEGQVLMELVKSGQREMLLPGGLGGRGNAAFKTGRNNAPQLAENGEAGAEMWLQLELKLVADVGIIGVPNAGKSTLLSVISAAKPEIANYPFTTLLPNLGVVALDYDATMVVADLPGLLEGAHTGTGLGHEFLRHTERCRVLVHVVDGMSLQPLEEFEAVRLELQLFNPMLSTKPFVVAFNKMDVPEAAERWEECQEGLRSKGIQPFCMSAATQEGTSAVVSAAYALWKQQQDRALRENKAEEETKAVAVAAIVRKQRSSPIEDFQIDADMHTRTWQVTGAGLERFTQMTNWEYFESVRRFQRVLDASGVNQALRKKGVREGDTVIVTQMEFIWMESDKMSALKDWKRAGRGSRHWPH